MRLTRKAPRDFVHVDGLWPADSDWASYYIGSKVWVFADEYHADLVGDEYYSRIIIYAGNGEGWIYHRRLTDKANVQKTLSKIQVPVSEKQLEMLGFTRWQEEFSVYT